MNSTFQVLPQHFNVLYKWTYVRPFHNFIFLFFNHFEVWFVVDHLYQWFSNVLHQVPPQKIFGFPSTTIMTNIKMQYKWLFTAPGVCVCVCVCSRCVCVCTLDGLNAEHKFRVCHVTFTFSSTKHSKKKTKQKRVSFNPYKDIYYCQPLKI